MIKLLRERLQYMKRIFEPVVASNQGRWCFFALCAFAAYGAFAEVYVSQILSNLTKSFEIHSISLFYRSVVIYGVITLVGYGVSYFARNNDTNSFWVFNRRIEEYMYSLFVNAESTKTEKYGTGKLLTVFTNGRRSWSTCLTNVVSNFFGGIIKFLFAVVLVFLQGGGLIVVLFLLFFVVSVVLNLIFLDKSKRFRRERVLITNERARVHSKILMSKQELMQTGGLITDIKKLFGYERKFLSCFKKDSNQRLYTNDLLQLTFSLLRWGVYVYVGFGVFDGSLTLSQGLLYVLLSGVVKNSISDFTRTMMQHTQTFIDIENLRETLDELKPTKRLDEGAQFKFKTGAIALKDVTFAYEGKTVLKDFSLKVQGGKKTALVGHSGGGKTTIMKLIAGYVKPDQGGVTVDEQDLQSVQLVSYFKHMAYLTQDPGVFDGTVFENLTFGLTGQVEESQLNEALKAAHCDFVFDFEKGLETEIGERGVRLSGGQKQRLAIAKVFLKNPEIILLDEPTSALDSISEDAVAQALHRLFEGRTVVIIAHRLQTIKEADEIIVIEHGKILERGNHAHLSVESERYKRMLELQTRIS